MTTIIIVHGTGGRHDNTGEMYTQIEEQLEKFSPGVKVARCEWGEATGARLHGGLSIPNFASTRAVEAPPPDGEYEIALWDLLYRDPLYELRLLALQGGSASSFIPGRATPGEELNNSLLRIQVAGELQAKLEQAGVADLFAKASKRVTDSAPYVDALRRAVRPLAPYQQAVARAIVAQMIVTSQEQDRHERLVTDAVLRGKIVDLLVAQLGSPERGIVDDWIKRQVLGIATWYTKNHRGSFSDTGEEPLGDIILYQGRGEPVRDFIQKCVEEAEPPVVLLAHSLGGIACVDLLIMNNLPQVKLLITVGSQAPIVYELNALHSLSYGDPLPDHFPRWLNIYDMHDFLSYIGAGLFPGRVEDKLVDNRQPFPQAHSSYWYNDETWEAVAAAVRRVQP